MPGGTGLVRYLDELWRHIPKQTIAVGIAPIDTIVGPFVDTSLHEFAHALFDMLQLPVLGRLEDAADQVSQHGYGGHVPNEPCVDH